jgi:hypothetical protein
MGAVVDSSPPLDDSLPRYSRGTSYWNGIDPCRRTTALGRHMGRALYQGLCEARADELAMFIRTYVGERA